MPVRATSCGNCGRTVFLAKNSSGNVRTLELLEHTFRIDGERFVPCVGVYVDHDGRCPGDVLTTPDFR